MYMYIMHVETLDRLKRDSSAEYCVRSTPLQVQHSTTAIIRNLLGVLLSHRLPEGSNSSSLNNNTAVLPLVAAVTLSERILQGSSYVRIFCSMYVCIIRIGWRQ